MNSEDNIQEINSFKAEKQLLQTNSGISTGDDTLDSSLYVSSQIQYVPPLTFWQTRQCLHQAPRTSERPPSMTVSRLVHANEHPADIEIAAAVSGTRCVKIERIPIWFQTKIPPPTKPSIPLDPPHLPSNLMMLILDPAKTSMSSDKVLVFLERSTRLCPCLMSLSVR
jgi:hypothetical protein